MIFKDLERKRQHEKVMVLIKQQRCEFDYKINKCDAVDKSHRINNSCTEWSACMKLDPNNASTTIRLLASIISEAISNLVDPLSIKSILLLIVITFM